MQAHRIPTIYFIGVTTGRSSIMRVFPRWAERLGLTATIRGVDFAIHDRPDAYRGIVAEIREDPLSLGALVTTHKLDLLCAARDLFDELGPYARLLGEVSCISKAEGRLIGEAMDPISSGLALDAFLPTDHWPRSGGETFLMGAGGAALAMTANLIERAARRMPCPSRIIVSNRSPGRLSEMRSIHARLCPKVKIDYVLAPRAEDNDRVLERLPPGSLVVNATGLGKDRPGSPVTDTAQFPMWGIAWDFNYRGDLHFLEQARRQQQDRGLLLEDGWVYFLHGWTRVISEVFHVEIPVSGPVFNMLSDVAADARS